eukprot:SAG31_NODE_44726_length_261_cov_1.277778_1_plen_66_part_10
MEESNAWVGSDGICHATPPDADSFVLVAKVSELQSSPKLVQIDGGAVLGIFAVGATVFALQDRCPH